MSATASEEATAGPADAPGRRWAVLRALVFGYALALALVRTPQHLRSPDYPPSAFQPVGVARLLSAPLAPEGVFLLQAATLLTGALVLAGVRLGATAPAFGGLLLWSASYGHSFSMVWHTDNLPVLQLLVVSTAVAWERLAGWVRPGPRAASTSLIAEGTLRALTVAAYWVAGVAKLRRAGLDWAWGDELRHQLAYDTLRKLELGATHSPLGLEALGWDGLFPALATFTLLVELAAPLALLGPRVARLWCTGAWLFHLGVLVLMAIAFVFPLTGIAFASFLPVERLTGARSPALLRRPLAWLASRQAGRQKRAHTTPGEPRSDSSHS